MTSVELRAEVLRLYHAEAWPIGTIARTLGVHHDVVSRALKREGLPPIRAVRATILEPFLPFIRETLETYPRLQAQRLYDMCVDRGYPDGPDHFRHLLRSLRPKPRREPFGRLATLPAEQAQVDWGHFVRLSIGRARRQLVAFVMVLSWSRMIFMRFFLGMPMECFLRGHVSAFEFFEGVPRELLPESVPRNTFVVLLPDRLCGGRCSRPTARRRKEPEPPGSSSREGTRATGGGDPRLQDPGSAGQARR